ncbi:MAG TPA: hypothetical protein VG273_16330 [Bryobacteraceae bacterium]|jgi:hypothetical protein|nr:hypothetical protein [Bryobacteraceae bacterium]
MLLIPFTVPNSAEHYSIFVVLDDKNIERILAFDPAQIPFPLKGWESKKLTRIFIGFADPRALDKATDLLKSGRLDEALHFLSRSFEFRPDLGDHDGPPVSIKQPGE